MYGSKIASIRLARGYTQEYVANKIGINQRAYSKIEKDAKANVDEELLGKIADTLGVSVEDIANPMPIVMTFHYSPYSGQINGQENKTDTSLVELLKKQTELLQEELQQKGKIIEQLLKVMGDKNGR